MNSRGLQGGQRALHPRQVSRSDASATIKIESSRHRRPTVKMHAIEIERAAAETAPPRTRFARASTAPIDEDVEVPLVLPFRARRPLLATAITAAIAVVLLLILHHVIATA